MTTAIEAASTNVVRMEPSELKDFKGGNTRRKRNQASFSEMVESVRERGIIQMPIARPCDAGGYELVVGHNRRDAAIEVGLNLIDVEVRELSDKEALAMHLEENLVREGLTLSDQVDAAQRWLSFFNGDRESAAKRMSWSVKQLNERMALVNCVSVVMEALDEGKIAAGHALILSTMPEKIQVGSLKTILNEKLTVNDLRQRAAKIQLPLTSAKFDKADCQGCKHNSEKQAGLFGCDDDSEAKCSNGSCYRQKTQAHLAETRAELEERFGKVLFVSESLSSDRNTVAVENVGKEQFDSGCMGCESRAALLDDRPTREGAVIESQCLNTDCFKGCVAKHSDATAQAAIKRASSEAATSDSEAPKSTTSATSSTSSTTKSTAGVAYSPSSAVIEQHKAEIIDFGRSALAQHESFRLAVVIAAIENSVSGAREPNAEITSAKRITKLAKLEKPELLSLLSETVTRAITHGSQFGSCTDFSVFSQSIMGLGMKQQAIEAWKPSEASLKPYTIEGIKSVCRTSGFDKYQGKDEKSPYSKLAASGKAAFITGVVNSDFDWTSFAPTAYTDLLK